MFSPLYLKIFEKSPFLMKTPTQNFAHHTEVKKHPFGVKTPNLATLIEVFLKEHCRVIHTFEQEIAKFIKKTPTSILNH